MDTVLIDSCGKKFNNHETEENGIADWFESTKEHHNHLSAADAIAF